ncbi:MAG: hypothetical protein WCI36_01225 [bacterium]
MATREGKISKHLKKSICPWIPRDLEPGTKVFRYSGCKYAISEGSGIHISLTQEEPDFFEVPKGYICWDQT